MKPPRYRGETYDQHGDSHQGSIQSESSTAFNKICKFLNSCKITDTRNKREAFPFDCWSLPDGGHYWPKHDMALKTIVVLNGILF